MTDEKLCDSLKIKSGKGGFVGDLNNEKNKASLEWKIERLNEIGVALSVEGQGGRLFERILLLAQELSQADGGTFYSVRDDQFLDFKIVRNRSLGLRYGGSGAEDVPFAPISLYDAEGNRNESMVVAYSAIEGVTVNIPDAYAVTDFDFSGTKAFDHEMGYRSRSFLTVPLKDHEDDVIGVLQLINAKDPESGETLVFSKEDQSVVESLASQAAVALSNQLLVDSHRGMLEGFIEAIADAIDSKSPYTGNHCRRVPEITMMLAEAVNGFSGGVLKDYKLSSRDLYELQIASLLHDCGKVVTPVHVVDKSSRLQTIFDRVHLIDTRFEILKRDEEIRFLKSKIAALEEGQAFNPDLEQNFLTKLRRLEQDRDFIRQSNLPTEIMTREKQEELLRIASYRFVGASGEEQDFFHEDELKNLSITKGTLTEEERKVIQDHVVATINMLEKIPYPKHLKNVPEIAGGHHERIDGTGYPNGLQGEELSVQTRILGIADIFEALTSSDRPYKKALHLSEALSIMDKMVKTGHLDPDLYHVFIEEKIYLQYAKSHLKPYQIDLS